MLNEYHIFNDDNDADMTMIDDYMIMMAHLLFVVVVVVVVVVVIKVKNSTQYTTLSPP
jgi:heme/copper-type cytochrome/quinol oxidase subunit 2